MRAPHSGFGVASFLPGVGCALAAAGAVAALTAFASAYTGFAHGDRELGRGQGWTRLGGQLLGCLSL